MKTKTQHTPGPWSLESPLVVVGNSGRRFVATCGLSSNAENPMPENEANARLIAAAPELLALLKEARNRMIGSSPAIVSLAKRTDEAIAKASGL